MDENQLCCNHDLFLGNLAKLGVLYCDDHLKLATKFHYQGDIH